MTRSLPLADRPSASAPPTLRTRLAALTVPATLVRTDDGPLRCTACAHRCVLESDRAGACGVRFREAGVLRAPYGYVARSYVRPVETNTIYHVRPGALALTFGMYGCDLRCPYCHNWRVSQALREGIENEEPVLTTPTELVDRAVREGCEVLCAAYNEPMIAAEWVHDVFAVAKQRGLVTAIVSDAHTTREALELVRPVTDVFRIDLKSGREATYRTLGGRLGPVLAGIELAKELGFWVEIVTLVVPDLNDDPIELRELSKRLHAIDPDMPWHLNAFVPRYKLAAGRSPSALGLVAVAGAAYNVGLRHVYVGNLADQVRELSHTRCHACHEVVVERHDYRTRYVHLGPDGSCPHCGTHVAGVWSAGTSVGALFPSNRGR